MRRLFASFQVSARDVLRRAARADQRERDELALRLEREPGGRAMAGLMDRMTLNQAFRQQVARVLGELETRELVRSIVCRSLALELV